MMGRCSYRISGALHLGVGILEDGGRKGKEAHAVKSKYVLAMGEHKERTFAEREQRQHTHIGAGGVNDVRRFSLSDDFLFMCVRCEKHCREIVCVLFLLSAMDWTEL